MKNNKNTTCATLYKMHRLLYIIQPLEKKWLVMHLNSEKDTIEYIKLGKKIKKFKLQYNYLSMKKDIENLLESGKEVIFSTKNIISNRISVGSVLK